MFVEVSVSLYIPIITSSNNTVVRKMDLASTDTITKGHLNVSRRHNLPKTNFSS